MELPKTALPIRGALFQWADIDGSIYGLERRKGHKNYNQIFKKSQHLCHGYKYCSINYKDRGSTSRRVHRIIAETFLPNPDNLPVVGHKNNIKSDNRVANLYWTTYSENTQKAVDDGLLVNDKGADDSQSMPVKMYETTTNKLLGEYGSASEAVRELHVSMTTILRQCKYKRPVRKPYYFRFADDKDCLAPQRIIGQFDFETGQLMNTFFNMGEASRCTGLPEKIVSKQCKLGAKPKWTKAPFYFNYLD